MSQLIYQLWKKLYLSLSFCHKRFKTSQKLFTHRKWKMNREFNRRRWIMQLAKYDKLYMMHKFNRLKRRGTLLTWKNPNPKTMRSSIFYFLFSDESFFFSNERSTFSSHSLSLAPSLNFKKWILFQVPKVLQKV